MEVQEVKKKYNISNQMLAEHLSKLAIISGTQDYHNQKEILKKLRVCFDITFEDFNAGKKYLEDLPWNT